jgi:hypothetical protein
MNEVELERIRYCVFQTVTEKLAGEFALPLTVEISDTLDWFSDGIVLCIRQDTFGRALDKVEIKYPADWWQAFKQRWFPKWILKRYPVIETVQVIDIKALYPTIDIQEHKAILNVWESDYNTGDDDDD